MEQQQQPLQADARPAQEEQAAATNTSSSSNSRSRDPQQQRQQWLQRLVRVGVAAVKAVLVLELFATLAGPAIARRLRSRRSGSQDDSDVDGSDAGFDPADVLVAYLTGAAGACAARCGASDGRMHRRTRSCARAMSKCQAASSAVVSVVVF